MSFKRDGNDDQWLSRLTKRRVSELLADDIPEEEAFIMKNGRLCCKVCHHRPTFDTLEMLSLHRKGKKHETNAVVFYEQQTELLQLREKAIHLGGSPNVRVLGAAGSSGSFLKSQPYNPQLKRKRLKPNERRQQVQLSGSPLTEEAEVTTTKLSCLPGHQGTNDRHHTLGTSARSFSSDSTKANSSDRSCSGDSRPNVIGALRPGPNQKLPQTISEYIKLSKAVNKKPVSVKPYMRKDYPSHNTDTQMMDTQNVSLPKTTAIITHGGAISQGSAGDKANKKTRLPSTTTPNVTAVDEIKKHAAQKYLQATSSGWKLDWTRQKWVKDEDVEFDSDEEPPELPS